MGTERPKFPEPGWSNTPPGDVVQQLPQRDAAETAPLDKQPEPAAADKPQGSSPPAADTTTGAGLSGKSQTVTPPKRARVPTAKGKRAGTRARK